MKVYNSPTQARMLREAEERAANVQPTPVDHGDVQPVQTPEPPEEKEAGPETEAERPAKKARSKKDTKKV